MTQPTAVATTDATWLPDWLTSWKPGDWLPETITTGALRNLETELRDRPATAKEFLVAIEPLFRFGQTFNVKTDTKDATAIYREVLRDLPASVIHAAVKSTIWQWTWGNRLPLPAEILAHVPAQHRRRQQLRAKVRAALRERAGTSTSRRSSSDESGYGDLTPSQRREHRVMMQRALAALRACQPELKRPAPVPRHYPMKRAATGGGEI